MEKTTKVSVIGLGFSVGLAWAIAILIGGVLAMIFNQWENVKLFTGIMNLVYPGWGRTIFDTLLMTLWSFTQGFVAGFLIGIFYNIFAKKFN